MATTATDPDVIAFLTAQHQTIRTLLGAVMTETGDARAAAFTNVRRMLAVHETAEELIVHPVARRAHGASSSGASGGRGTSVRGTGVSGTAVVEARLSEEHDAKVAVAALEKLDVDSPEFELAFQQLHADVLAHAEAEEKEEFPLLEAKLTEEQLAAMRRTAELIEKLAPTRPHPGVESGLGNLLVGPFAAMLDRARDALAS